jgi:rubrerythrin
MTPTEQAAIAEVAELASGRRSILKAGMAAGLLSVVSLLDTPATAQKPAAKPASKTGDIDLMNVALALEHQAIAAYDLGAASGLLKGDALALAVHFQNQHKAHRDLLTETVKKFGGAAAQPLAKYEFADAAKIKTAEDVLVFALGLEAGATSAYLSTLTKFATKELIPVVAGIACDEAQHAAAIRMALKQQPAPDAVVK